MKKIILLLGLIATMILCVACGNKKSTKVMKLAFKINPTTGYDLEYKFLEGDKYANLILDKEDYLLNDDLSLVGAPGTKVFYFRATKSGKQEITFTYRRPWEGGEVAYDVVYEISVDKELNIKCTGKRKGVVESNMDINSMPEPEFEE